MEILDIDVNLDNFDLNINNNQHERIIKINKILPEIVLRYIRYSKLDISRLCHRCVIFAERNNCFGDANEVRLLE